MIEGSMERGGPEEYGALQTVGAVKSGFYPDRRISLVVYFVSISMLRRGYGSEGFDRSEEILG